MILRKPYAFFIKMFKPMHLMIGVLIGFLMVTESKIFSFLDKNLYTSLNLVGQNIKSEYVNSSLFVIPIVLIILFVAILTIMFNRKKPVTFYVVSIFSLIAILVINNYVSDFFATIEESIVSIKSVKLIHDLVFISMFIEGVLLVFVIIRGAGVDIRKFNFDSDISKIDIKDTDNEEFEVNIKFNIDKTRRERNKRIRYLKYAYVENRVFVNIGIAVFLFLVGIVTFLLINNRTKIYNENEFVSTSTCSIMVDGSYILNTSYDGTKITDNYLVVVDLKIGLNYVGAKTYLKDFNIDIKDATYTPTTMYNKYLVDLGDAFKDDKLSLDATNHILVYEVPEKVINSKIVLTYNDGEKINYIRLKPENINGTGDDIVKTMSEEMQFDGKLQGASITINSYDIQDRFAVKYNYCIKSDDCTTSVEYIKGTLNKNYDKSVIRLDILYKNESELKLSKFYNLLTTFGYIEYKLKDEVKIQKDIEHIVANKLVEKNVVYLGVNKEIKDAEEVNIVFNVRGKKYIYKVK